MPALTPNLSQLNAQRRRAVQLRVDGHSLTQVRAEPEVVGIRGARRRAGATATSLAQARRRLAARVVIGPSG